MWQIFLLSILRPLYILTILLLSIYSFFLLTLAILFWWQKLIHKTPHQNEPVLTSDEELPIVAIQIPLYNEKVVAVRIINEVAKMDYPRQKLHIQILDDSTDGTSTMVAERVAHWQKQGVWITHHQRENRENFKAGALKAAMEHTPADLFAIFDADFIPPTDWLKGALQPFLRSNSERVGFVQTRWTHLNEDYSLVTQSQALGLEGVFGVEQVVCTHYGLFNFMNGTGMLLRRQAIEDAGSWLGDVLVEDMDLGLRMQLKGWKAVYLRDVTAPAELPGVIASYKIQQSRWAKGSMQIVRRLGMPILRSNISIWNKMYVLLRILSYMVCPLILVMLVLSLPLYTWSDAWIDRLPIRFLGFAGVGFPLLFLSAHITLYPRKDWWKYLVRIAALSILGSGMAINNTRAMIEGLTRKKSIFECTPKFGVKNSERLDLNNIPVRLHISPTNWLEIVIALYALTAVILSLIAQNYVAVSFFASYVLGFAWVAGAEWIENIAALRSTRKALTQKTLAK